MGLFSHQRLAALSDGQLADCYYEMIDIDPEAVTAPTKAVVAEIDRRSVTQEQLSAAWNALARQMGTVDLD